MGEVLNQLITKIILSFSVSFLIQYLVIKLSSRRAFCIDCAETEKPQRFHSVTTPRAGGLGIFIAFAIGNLSLVMSQLSFVSNPTFFTCQYPLIFSIFPAFFAGFYEDMGSHISPGFRLFIMILGSVIAIILLDAIVYDTGLLRLPKYLAIPFTVFAIVGVTNSINIIDGFNGLASGVSLIALASFGLVAYIQGDYLILSLALILIFSILGFFAWNFPRGKIFLGDSGAYIIGFLLAILSILTVKRNPEISPWFPLAVLSYPIVETLFSIYRRKFIQKKSPLKQDGLHLHTLVYKRVAKGNPKTSLYIWPLVSFLNILALIFHSNTFMLILIFVLFLFSYIYIYQRLVRFKGAFFKNKLKEKVKMDIPVKNLDSIKVQAKTIS
jgi:UDP-GlcNAc:undecaprenyl-phosphate GlcNAc-1-phosphate transferase